MRLAALCLLLLGAPAWGQGARDFLSGDYFESDVAPAANEPLTLACWVQPDTSLLNAVVFLGDKDVTNNSFQLRQGGASRVECQAFGGTAASSITTDTYDTTRWNHFACVFASDTSRTAYLDGVAATENTTSISVTGVDRTSIGRNGDSTPGQDLNGQLSHCAIWSVALGAGEIADLAGGKSPLSVGSPKLYCPFQEAGVTDNCLDMSGNGNDLTQTGSPGVIADSPPFYIPGPPP